MNVWLARGGYVMTADNQQMCYQTDARPEGAPTEEQDPTWATPGPLFPDDSKPNPKPKPMKTYTYIIIIIAIIIAALLLIDAGLKTAAHRASAHATPDSYQLSQREGK